MDIFKKIKPMSHKFRDPIYGFIELNDSEIKIIDTPIFQRLRRIHQLALTKYVYPTAEHSRFTHSLGVMQAATEIFLNICMNSDLKLLSFNEDKNDIEDDLSKKLQILRFASLLHDVGHLPFSHATEDVILNEKATHETIGQFIIKHYKPISNAIRECDIDPSHVAGLLSDNAISEFFILKRIVSGELDADRADYLLRDSYACGVKYGEYDYKRYIKSFFLIPSKNGISRLCIDEKNIFLVESFLLARYHYSLQVLYHKTRVGYDLVLKKYIEGLGGTGRLKKFINYDENFDIQGMDFDYFEFFDDYKFFEMIKGDYRKESNQWAKMLLRQDHLFPIYDSINTDDKVKLIFKQLLMYLHDSDLNEDSDFFKYIKVVNISKLVHDESADDQLNNHSLEHEKHNHPVNILELKIKGAESPVNILSHSNILRQFVKPIEIYRIYVTKKHKIKAEQIKLKASEYIKKLLSE